MSKFLTQTGAQIEDLQRQISEPVSTSTPSQPIPRPHLNNVPKRPSRLKNSFRPTSTISTSSTPLLRTGGPDPREPALQRQGSLVERNNGPTSSESGKLGTFEGVYLQVVLSIWGVILYLRLGYILGQVGLIVTLSMFTFGYCITTFTTLSLSAISTNGVVRGGGPYYMISRSLGPEFGGSIGIIVYLGTTLNGVLNALAAVEGLQEFFSIDKGTVYRLLPDGWYWEFSYGSAILAFSLLICLMGSRVVSKVCLIFSILLLLSTLSVLFTFLLRAPFEDPTRGLVYTSLSWDTLYDNLWPQLSINGNGVMETFHSIFGVLFPACIGILAGASMSGNLKHPSKAIPKGTLSAIATTFIAYVTLTVLFAATTTRETLKNDISVLTHIGLFPPLVNIGVLATSLSSAIACFMGASKILQAMSRDDLVPFLRFFGFGSSKGDEPLMALVLTYFLCQGFILAGEINLVAGVVTMFFSLTFGVTNLACFLLKVGAAPNFRPSFRYFKGWTAFVGVVICFSAMFYVDPTKALLSTVFACSMFGVIHFSCSPKPWGDVTQSLIYHQVRKYLLRLDSRKDHVKFWRPQILLLVNDPRSSFQLIQFCNALKKGSLYILGHVLRGDLRAQLGELKRQKIAWLRFVDVSRIKAFVQLAVASDERLGARNLLLGSGLGGMTPNILVMGNFNLQHFRRRSVTRLDSDSDSDHSTESPTVRTPLGPSPLSNLLGPLPTDEMKSELPISLPGYVGIIEDALLLGKAVAIAYEFNRTPLLPCLPKSLQTPLKEGRAYIDLWPIQTARNDSNTVTNFDSYTMVLQLGCILHMVPQWRALYTLRVCCFVEHQADVEEERSRVKLLLDSLRVPAELHIFWLDGGAVEEYDAVLGPTAFMSSPQALTPVKGHAQEIPPISASLRINVPLPDEPEGYTDSSSTDSDTCDSDQLSDYVADLDGLASPTGLHNPHILPPSNFNELSAPSQHRILNNLMRLQSQSTHLIFSTLPAPELGCGDDPSLAHAYLESLESLVTGLPPTVLVHAKSLTVTTSL